MKEFKGIYLNFTSRLLFRKEYIIVFIFHTYLIFNFPLIKNYNILIEIIFFLIITKLLIFKTKSIVYKISFNENNVILLGENFNKKWKKIISLEEIRLVLKSESSRAGLRSAIFYIQLKSGKLNHDINVFSNFKDEQIIEIFDEFKLRKVEKITLDERLIILRLKEKIIKCQ